MIHPISFGWGRTQEGSLRKPKEHNSHFPILFDDSIIGTIDEQFIQELLPYCSKGCILDWEQKPSKFHSQILQSLHENKVHPIWAPQKYISSTSNVYCMIPCELPHNSWKNYCATQQRLHKHGWTLEYHPLQFTTLNRYEKGSTFLQDAVCMIESKNGRIYYYDTMQTIIEKRRIAAQFGCKGMIGIAEEWRNLRKK